MPNGVGTSAGPASTPFAIELLASRALRVGRMQARAETKMQDQHRHPTRRCATPLYGLTDRVHEREPARALPPCETAPPATFANR
jgi:hypothetical protein